MIIGKRILTTHAGSLPRPPQLVELDAPPLRALREGADLAVSRLL